MRCVSVGIDPGKEGAIVVTEGRQILNKWVVPTKQGEKGRFYLHVGIEAILRQICDEYGQEDLVCGLEISRPIPTKEVLSERRYYDFAEQMIDIYEKSKGFSGPAVSKRFITDASIEAAKALIKDFLKHKEPNSTSYQQGAGVMLWFVHLHYHKQIRWQGFDPRRWHDEICKGLPGEKPKDRALVACERLYPGEDLTSSSRGRVPHKGIVDAACIAEMARRKFWPGMGNSLGGKVTVAIAPTLF